MKNILLTVITIGATRGSLYPNLDLIPKWKDFNRVATTSSEEGDMAVSKYLAYWLISHGIITEMRPEKLTEQQQKLTDFLNERRSCNGESAVYRLKHQIFGPKIMDDFFGYLKACFAAASCASSCPLT